jgi:hypothetical protein
MCDQPMPRPSTRQRTTRRALAFALAIAWLGPVAAAAQDGQTARERVGDNIELEDLLRNRTIHGIYADGNKWLEYHAPNGLTAYWDGCTHPGKWWVADGLVCYRYPEDPAQAEYCWFIYREDGQLEFVSSPDGADGPVGAYSEDITSGNSEHLPLGASDCLSADASATNGPQLQ